MKVYSVADEGGVVDESESTPILRHVALEQQLLLQLDTNTRLEHPPVTQAVDHDDHIVVELTDGLPAEVKGLFQRTSKTPT